MNWLRTIFTRLVRWLTRRPAPLYVKRVEELPDNLDPRAVYLVGEGEYLWFAAMVCPCGCGATLHMSLMPDSRPRWEVTEHADGTITLDPSVWRVKDCRSHFFLRRGQIIWCSATTPSE